MAGAASTIHLSRGNTIHYSRRRAREREKRERLYEKWRTDDVPYIFLLCTYVYIEENMPCTNLILTVRRRARDIWTLLRSEKMVPRSSMHDANGRDGFTDASRVAQLTSSHHLTNAPTPTLPYSLPSQGKKMTFLDLRVHRLGKVKDRHARDTRVGLSVRGRRTSRPAHFTPWIGIAAISFSMSRTLAGTCYGENCRYSLGRSDRRGRERERVRPSVLTRLAYL